MSKLNVPYFSQWDADGSDNQNDCGPTSLKMVLSYFGKTITVNEINAKAGAGKNDSNWTQLQKAAKELGFESSLLRNQSKQSVMGLVDSEYPCIVVLHYGDLEGSQDDYKGPHILVITGYDSGGYFVNDPDFWGASREKGHDRYCSDADFDKAWGSKVDGNQPFTIMKVEGTPPVVIPEIKVKEDILTYYENVLGLKAYSWYDKHFTWVQMFKTVTEWWNKATQYDDLTKKLNDITIERNEFSDELKSTQDRVKVLTDEKAQWMGTADEYLKKLNAQSDIVSERDNLKTENEQLESRILELESPITVPVALGLLVTAIQKSLKKDG